MPARTASHYYDALGIEQIFLVVNHGAQRHIVRLRIDAPSHAVAQTFRLVEDFLQHEMGVAALLYLTEVQIDGLHLRGEFDVLDVHHLQILAEADHGDIVVVKVNHLVCIFYNRCGV